MKPLPQPRSEPVPLAKQRGVVLLFTLIALVVMSLAAVALIRSVDTSGMIAGNLAFKQSSMTSGDFGTENAINWLTQTEAANNTMNVDADLAHPFNITNAANGYYSNVDNTLDLFADATWNASTIPETVDSSGNRIRYIIQRMCRSANQLPTTLDCLFSDAQQDTNGKNVPLPQEICKGDGCPSAGQSPLIRITIRSQGPKNTVSYLQAFVY
jgi:type IV pilus assembly protein PilX